MSRITTQIKIIGFTLSAIAIGLTILTFTLNLKSKNDANVVNIAGKERMLTQKMAKELFLGLDRFGEFESAKNEFMNNLHKLISGSEQDGITPPPSELIKTKLLGIEKESKKFFELSERLQGGDRSNELIKSIYVSNNELLAMIDSVVGEYTTEFEAKRKRLEALQYVGGTLILFAAAMSSYLIRKIETRFERFLSETKEIGSLRCEDGFDKEVGGDVSTAGELDQAKSELKNFMAKVQKVVQKAEAALNESQNAIFELESSARVMDERLKSEGMDEKTKKEMEGYIDKSEDLTISSIEDIAATKAMLHKFREMLIEIDKKIA